MFVYMKTTSPRAQHRMFVTPACSSESVEFRNEDGSPKTFQVVFYDGRADVPNNLGRWMVDSGHASSLILPAQRLVNAVRRVTNGRR